MKLYQKPTVKEIRLHAAGFLALSIGNEEGEGEYTRSQRRSNSRPPFGSQLWEDSE